MIKTPQQVKKNDEEYMKFPQYRVAIYIAGVAEDTGQQYTTGNEEIAELTAHTLARMVEADTPNEVASIVGALIKSFKVVKPTMDIWTYLCLNVNWLSWAWHEEGNDTLSEAWADQWYKIDEFTLDTLKGKDLTYYVKARD